MEVQTATLDDLIQEALTQGAAAAGMLAAAAGEIGSAFRSTERDDASRRMAEFGESIRSLLSVLVMVASARGLSLDQMTSNGATMSARLGELSGQLESVVEAQQSRDWLTVADILEYEFQPALSAWQTVFETLRVEFAPTLGCLP